MTYRIFSDQYIHPFIIYVLLGTLVSFILVRLAANFSFLCDAKSRVQLLLFTCFVKGQAPIL